ncbi:MAG: tetratricopeptide repeat protein [Woeseiaceae bacterium]|nr:tetratricopeptide repeat protein [Woeseiaceae bacterium]
MLRQNPDNFTALNNLAWLYFTSGDSRAEALARRAYEAAPDNGSVADTLGWILVSNGSLDEGVDLLRRAVELSDGRATIRYHPGGRPGRVGQHGGSAHDTRRARRRQRGVRRARRRRGCCWSGCSGRGAGKNE